VYSAAKAAVNQLTVSLALTHARDGLRVNAIMPGMIDTPMVSLQVTADPAALAARHEASPTGRMGQPMDIRMPPSSSPLTERPTSTASACPSMADSPPAARERRRRPRAERTTAGARSTVHS
jgi:NAD(P)-dependent dehydrogenase (short-subunit alcohol dehydrogenase family)